MCSSKQEVGTKPCSRRPCYRAGQVPLLAGAPLAWLVSLAQRRPLVQQMSTSSCWTGSASRPTSPVFPSRPCVSPLQHAGVEVQLLARPLLGALHVNVRTSRGDAEAASASSQHDVLPRRRGPARRTRRGARSPSIFLGAIRLGFVRLVRRSKPRRPALPEQCMRHPPLSKVRLPLSINFRRSSVPRQQPDAAPFSLRPSVTFVDEALTQRHGSDPHVRPPSLCPASSARHGQRQPPVNRLRPPL